jgi:predicted transposase YbfD/YdcC
LARQEQNRIHWVLNPVFKDDRSRLPSGRGARNMAAIRRLDIKLVSAAVGWKCFNLHRASTGTDT